MQLTPPGDIFRADFRPSSPRQGNAPPCPPVVRMVQFNIERGYKLDAIIPALREIDADILSLQEVDVGCDRSGGVDTGTAIAEALRLNYAFLSEFEELRSPVRDARSQGGGVHGNAILTKYDFADLAVIHHSLHPVDWNDPTNPFSRREPRRGRRAVLRARISTPCGPLVVYNAHLEVFCGMLARIMQLQDVFADSIRQLHAGFHYQAILGDLNTMAHGIARLSNKYCRDRMRWRTLGTDEAVVWERHVLTPLHPKYLPLASQDDARMTKTPSLQRPDGHTAENGGPGLNIANVSFEGTNPKLLKWGFTAQHALLNPGFSCPFPALKTVTLDNPSYRWMGISLMRGKLDWALLRRLKPVKAKLGNLDYSISDHRWLYVEAAFD